MTKIILLLIITFGFAQASAGYWNCTKSYGQCTYMKYDKENKNFTRANYLPKGETVYSFSPLVQHGVVEVNTISMNFE